MKGSFSVSVFIALSSLLIVSDKTHAQNAGRPGTLQIIEDMKTVNSVINSMFVILGNRCANQLARKRWVDEAVAKQAPALAKLVADKAAADATLALAARDLTTAQNAVGAANSAINAIDVQLRDRNLAGARQIAAIEGQISQAVAEKEVAADLLARENDSWEKWEKTGTNDDDLDEAANRQFNNQPLTPRDRDVLAALSRHLAAVDTLEARGIQAENQVAAFLRTRQDTQNGLRQSVEQLKQQKDEKLADKRSAEDRVKTLTLTRNLKQTEVRSLTARISKLSAIKAPAINVACKAFPATR